MENESKQASKPQAAKPKQADEQRAIVLTRAISLGEGTRQPDQRIGTLLSGQDIETQIDRSGQHQLMNVKPVEGMTERELVMLAANPSAYKIVSEPMTERTNNG